MGDIEMEHLMRQILEKKFNSAIHKACNVVFDSNWKPLPFEEIEKKGINLCLDAIANEKSVNSG